MGLSRSTKISILLGIDVVFFLVEIIVGYIVGSLALVADSFHMLNDVVSLVISLYAIKVSARDKARKLDLSTRYSYGRHRAEILAALANGVFLLALCFSIVLEAIQRFFSKPDVSNPKLVVIVGAVGLAFNIFGLFLFHEHDHSHSHGSSGEHISVAAAQLSQEVPMEPIVVNPPPPTNTANKPQKSGSMNMKALVLHVVGDALGNIGVIASGLIIWLTTPSWRFYFDPIISLVITVIIFSSALPLVRKASFVLLQGVPNGISLEEVEAIVRRVEGVEEVHELHIWQLSETKLIASMHLRTTQDSDFMEVASGIKKHLHDRGIHSVTIQPEYDSASGRARPAQGSECLLMCQDDCDLLENACCPPLSTDA